LAKPTESEGFEQILNFLNANPIKYALTVNPIIYTSCIERFWATAKVKTVNGEVQLQALLDGKKVIITETSVRRDLQLEDAEGIKCLSNANIFEQLALMSMVKNIDSSVKFLMYPRFVQVFLDKQVGDMSTHDEIFVTSSHTKKVFGNMKRVGKGFSGAVTPLFPTMMVHAQEEMGEDEAATEENVPTQSNDLPLSRVNTLESGEDRLKLKELMDLYTKLSDRSTTTIAPSIIPKTKIITFRDPGESTTRTTLTPIPSNIKDKGKANMIELEKPLKKREQIRLDEELSLKLQAEEEEQARLARKKAAKDEKVNISWDNSASNDRG
ncbi:hypothetical protein Tco_1486721, partial [Tanacetum coccineum]